MWTNARRPAPARKVELKEHCARCGHGAKPERMLRYGSLYLCGACLLALGSSAQEWAETAQWVQGRGRP